MDEMTNLATAVLVILGIWAGITEIRNNPERYPVNFTGGPL
jgi:hypothetical protein